MLSVWSSVPFEAATCSVEAISLWHPGLRASKGSDLHRPLEALTFIRLLGRVCSLPKAAGSPY